MLPILSVILIAAAVAIKGVKNRRQVTIADIMIRSEKARNLILKLHKEIGNTEAAWSNDLAALYSVKEDNRCVKLTNLMSNIRQFIAHNLSFTESEILHEHNLKKLQFAVNKYQEKSSALQHRYTFYAYTLYSGLSPQNPLALHAIDRIFSDFAEYSLKIQSSINDFVKIARNLSEDDECDQYMGRIKNDMANLRFIVAVIHSLVINVSEHKKALSSSH